MNETNTSLSLQKKSKKSRTGFSLIIVIGILVLAIILLLGIYRYLSEAPEPKSSAEERVASDRLAVSEPKPDESSAPSSDAEQDEESATHPDPEGPGGAELLGPDQELPVLGESDVFVRGRLASLSDRPEYAQWIGADHLISKITMLVDNISRGAIPAARIRHFAPKGKFSALEKSPDQYLMDPKGYHRYNLYADTLASLDLSAGLRIFYTLKPLFDAAYQELGYPSGNFDQVLRRAIKHLLAAPVLSGDVALVRPSVTYRFADPKLESLSRAQKQLIRTGPRNTRIIQSALRDFLTQLDQPPSQPMQSEVSE